MCVCVVCILYCYTISWNISMAFAYPLTQLAPFSLGLHSSSKLSSPEQHPWSVILHGMQRTLSRKVVAFSSVWLCTANSHLWLDIAFCWLFTGPVNYFQTSRYRTSSGNSFTASFTSLRCTISARIPPDACLATWDAGMSSQDARWKVEIQALHGGKSFQIGVMIFGDCWWMGEGDRTFQFTDTKSALITNFFTLSFWTSGFFPDC